jgi:hypothetical protein
MLIKKNKKVIVKGKDHTYKVNEFVGMSTVK